MDVLIKDKDVFVRIKNLVRFKLANSGRYSGIKTLAMLSIIAVAQLSQAQFSPLVIYGDDNRKDYYQEASSTNQDLADSTVALFSNSDIQIDSVLGLATLKESSFKARYGLCDSEPFADQNIGAFCSGFLVGPDLIATAGHCITKSECADVSFVFGYKKTEATSDTSKVPSKNVFRCKEVVSREENYDKDYALVKLDRPVENFKPLKLSNTQVQTGDKLLMIGHPSGLPVKIADEAIVRNLKTSYFVASTDSYGGNSGSAVFNSTGDVVGILVRGEADYVYDSARQCKVSKVCAENGCRGEDITFISYISDALKLL